MGGRGVERKSGRRGREQGQGEVHPYRSAAQAGWAPASFAASRQRRRRAQSAPRPIRRASLSAAPS
eukprot:153894-Chlamydomonas_euryale.AAC.2